MKRIALVLAMLATSVSAFAPVQSTSRATTSQLSASIPQEWKDKAAIASAALITINIPVWASFAVEDDYEYGAVDAPIAIPIVGGILAIATALLPIALRPGEEAFEEVSIAAGSSECLRVALMYFQCYALASCLFPVLIPSLHFKFVLMPDVIIVFSVNVSSFV